MALNVTYPGRSFRDYIGRIRANNTRNSIETASALEAIQDSIDSLVDALTSVVDYINSSSTTGAAPPAGTSLGELDVLLTADTGISAPPANYQLLVVIIRQDGTPPANGWAVTWDPIYRSEQLVNFPINPDPNKPSVYLFALHDNEYWLLSANISV